MTEDKTIEIYRCSSIDTTHTDLRYGSHTDVEYLGKYKEVHDMLTEFLKDPHLTRFEIVKTRGVEKRTSDDPNAIAYYEERRTDVE